MPSPVPTPVAAALGIVPAVLSGVRSLPGKAISLPFACVSSALTSLDRTRRGYDDLAERGERLIARLRGTSFDELEDRFEDSLQGTPLAAPYDKVEDALEDATENVSAFVRSAPSRARKAAGKVEKTVTDPGTAADLLGSATKTAEDAAGTVSKAATDLKAGATDAADDLKAGATKAADEVKTGATKAADEVKTGATGAAADLKDGAVDLKDDSTDAAAGLKAGAGTATKASTDLAADLKAAATDAADDVKDGEAPKGVPTPKATQPDATPVDTAATPEVVDTVEQVSAAVGGEVVDRDELPLADFDHLTLGAVRGRMRSLDTAQLVQLRDYEKSKGNRLPIVTMLDNRIAKLATDPSAAPSAGEKPAPAAKKPAKRAKKTAGKVSPATANKGASAPTAAFGGLGASVPDKG